MNKSDDLFGGEGNGRVARPTKHTKSKTNKLITAASQNQSQKPEQEQTSKKGFLWGVSDGVDHVAIEVLQHDVANRDSLPAWRSMCLYSITVGFSPRSYC